MTNVNLWISWEGRVPTYWYEEIIRNGQPTGRMEEVRLDVPQGANPPPIFAARLARKLWQMFSETMSYDKDRDSLDTSYATSENKHLIQNRDLLIFACFERDRDSVLQRLDRDLFNATLAKHGRNVGGLTAPLKSGAILSEAYFDVANRGLTAMADNVYHEWLHNKSHWDEREDPNWVHGLDGLAAAKGGGGLTPRVKAAMNARLQVANRQAIEGIR